MAKCVSSKTNWQPNIIGLEDKEFLTDVARVGENLLNIRLEHVEELTRDIYCDYSKIKCTTYHEDTENWDFYQLQGSIVEKLEQLLTDIPSLIQAICDEPDLITATKHRYFLHYSCGVLDKLRKLLITVGRLNDLDAKLYFEEQQKPLVSEESMTIHALTSIWSGIIVLMNSFLKPTKTLFQKQLETDEFCFIKELDCWLAGTKYSRIFLMDLTITSWIQFNRLVKYEDLLKKLPFLCPCHKQTYFKTFELANITEEEPDFLSELLNCILKHDGNPSMLTQTITDYNIVPIDSIYMSSSEIDLAYFIIWHLYSLARLSNESSQRRIICNCIGLMIKCFDLTMKQFFPKPDAPLTDFRLSPHQEERFKLIFAMFDNFYDKMNNEKCIPLVTKLFEFFEDNWLIFGEKYFDNDAFRIEKLTVFQLTTKLAYDIIPINTINNQATGTDEILSEDKKKLNNVWTKLLSRIPLAPAKSNSADSNLKKV